MIELIPKIFYYKLFSILRKPYILPINFTVSVTYKCFSRCKTCNVWKREVKEFDLLEYEKTFKSIGNGPFWFTLSGGEPFSRNDLEEIVKLIVKYCKPAIINIPTNGFLDKIPERVENILKFIGNTKLIINLSIDQIGEKHDEIRGLKKSYEKVINTFNKLKNIQNKNLTIGIATVISKYNMNDIPNLWGEVIKLKPDSYVLEIAENREELKTLENDISPLFSEYEKCVNFLEKEISKNPFSEKSKITLAFRQYYYKLTLKNILNKKQTIPCFAGIASTHISPDGDIWFCCIKAKSVGNLRENDYSFRKIWLSEEAWNLRKEIKKGNCYCPLANVSYTNILCSLKGICKVLYYYLLK